MQPSSRVVRDIRRIAGWGWLVTNLALCAALLSACGNEAVEGPRSPEEVKEFEAVIADAGCMSCHLPGNSVGGPTWKAVAKKYRKNKAGAEKLLMNKIAHGGSGAWGKTDMPPYPELRESDLRVMVRGILERDSAKAD